MNETEKVVEHLKMIQAVIDRLGRNGFWVKTWSLALIVAATILIAIYYVHLPYFSLILIPFVLAFWILDGYFLWGERLFRKGNCLVHCFLGSSAINIDGLFAIFSGVQRVDTHSSGS